MELVGRKEENTSRAKVLKKTLEEQVYGYGN
jgi:hypothetical protein